MKTMELTRTEVAEQTCRHHWVIDTPHGPVSKGECRLCGAQAEFRNSADDYLWEGDGPSSLAP